GRARPAHRGRVRAQGADEGAGGRRDPELSRVRPHGRAGGSGDPARGQPPPDGGVQAHAADHGGDALTTVLVTGAQQGIGRAMALAFARGGAAVGINYLDDRAAAERVAGEVVALGGTTALVQGDVAQVAEAHALVADVARQLGGLDVLINNAGVYP